MKKSSLFVFSISFFFSFIVQVAGFGQEANDTQKNAAKFVANKISVLSEKSVSYSFTNLEEAITKSHALLNSATEGNGEGEYPAQAKTELQSSINSAMAFVGSDTTQAGIDSVISELYDACSTFESQVITTPVNIVDKKANKQTRYLYLNLKNQMDRSLLFGMQHATGYGVGWSNDDERSDIKDVCGDFPAIYGEDLSYIVQDSIGRKDDDRFRYRVISAYERGAVITISWHQRDPDNRHFYASEINNEKIVQQILPGGARHEDYKARLKKAAEFFKSLRGKNGEAIPIIFRPYHEHIGTWFWWGVGHCTIAQYNLLWRFTVDYLHNTLNVHNLLWAISPNLDHVDEGNEYFERFPGNEYVDIYGFDFYHHGPVPPAVITDYTRDLNVVVQHALNNDKIPALTEIGQEGLDDINWHTRMMINPIKHDSLNNSIAYAVTWRNANDTHFHAPYPGHPSVPDFIDFYNDPYTLFESDLPNMYALPEADLSAPVFTNYPGEKFVSPTTSVEIKVETDERSLLRWSYTDEEFDNMPNLFEFGQRMYAHSTFIEAEQGSESTIYVHAMDVFGNKTDQSIPISFTVDTLQAKIVWYDPNYSVGDWKNSSAPFGSGSDVTTNINDVQTAYFVKDLELSEKPGGARIIIQLNGGYAFYINGFEVARYRLPEEMVLDYDTPPLVSTKTAKAVDFLPEMVDKLKAGSNRIAVEVHGGSTGVEFFDALFQTDIEMVFYYGSNWFCYDLGDMPKSFTMGEILGVNIPNELIPQHTRLYQNYPNPFNSTTTIKYDITEAGLVTIEIYNILGQKVLTAVEKNQLPGNYKKTLDFSNHVSGIYVCILKIKTYTEVQKILYLK